MARFLHHDFPAWWRRGAAALLALSFVLGLVLGALLFLSAENDSTSLMRMAKNGPVSIVGLLSVSFLPFLISAFAVYVSQPWLLPVIALCKGASFSLVSLGVTAAYGSAGWLMRLLLMFSDLCALPLLLFFWLRYISGERRFTAWSACRYLAALLTVGSIDYCLISPFLAGL